jgi:hypothetical protein
MNTRGREAWPRGADLKSHPVSTDDNEVKGASRLPYLASRWLPLGDHFSTKNGVPQPTL